MKGRRRSAIGGKVHLSQGAHKQARLCRMAGLRCLLGKRFRSEGVGRNADIDAGLHEVARKRMRSRRSAVEVVLT